MRKNLPVTQNNYIYPAHQTLISITNLKGRITYCNQDFADVSGYSQAELLGQPHNILRHPDMPEEAFRDFWATIQSGQIWSALIKNRRKNGDTYWVRANATPMRNGNNVVGYLSVRTLPSKPETEQAEKLFAIMRKEAEHKKLRHVFKNGQVRRAGLIGAAQAFLRPGRSQVTMWLVLLAASGPFLGMYTQAPIGGVVLLTALTITLAWLGLARLLVAPETKVEQTARQLASGDLSQFVRIAEAGSMRELLLPIGQLALATRTVMGDVRSDLQTLSDQAQEVSTRSDDLAARTQAQAASLVETAAAMEEISGTVKQTSEATGTGVDAAHKSAEAVERSQEVVQNVSDLMQKIARSSGRIGEFVQVIEAVAFQTNILALNASVEAARAGDQGRGFAVVASEVRALSHRTTSAAKEIKDLIDESRRQTALGEQKVEEARLRMDEVVDLVGQVRQILEQIHVAAAEESGGVQEINTALQQLDQITQKNVDMVGGLSALSSAMTEYVKEAQNNIRVFRLSSTDVTHAEIDAVSLRKLGKAQLAEGSPI